MRVLINKWAGWCCLLGFVAAVFGGLVWGTFGRDHTNTRVVTRTETVTQTVTRKVNAHYAGPSTLIEFMQPQQAQTAACPNGAPSGTKCFNLLGDDFYVFLAVPPA